MKLVCLPKKANRSLRACAQSCLPPPRRTSPGKGDGFFKAPCLKQPDSGSRRDRTAEFSKTCAAGRRVKKPPTRARGLHLLTELSYPSASEGAPGRVTGTISHATLSSSPGMIAGREGVSSSADAQKLAFSGLNHVACDRGGLDVVGVEHTAVGTHAALVDHAAPVARRLAERLCQERGQMDGCLGMLHLRHLVPRLPLAHDAREVLLGGLGGVVPPRPAHDEARELELRLERVGRDVVALHYQSVPLLEQRVRDPHRLAELLLGVLLEANVVAARGAHSRAVP